LIGKSQWCCSANCGHPIARVNVQLDPRYASSTHITAPINHTRPSPLKHLPDVEQINDDDDDDDDDDMLSMHWVSFVL